MEHVTVELHARSGWTEVGHIRIGGVKVRTPAAEAKSKDGKSEAERRENDQEPGTEEQSSAAFEPLCDAVAQGGGQHPTTEKQERDPEAQEEQELLQASHRAVSTRAEGCG